MSCQLWWHWTVALNQHLYNDMQPVTNQHANKFVGIAAHRLNTTKHSSLCPAHLNSHLIDPHCLTMELTISMYSKCLIYDWCKKKSYQLPRTFQHLPNLFQIIEDISMKKGHKGCSNPSLPSTTSTPYNPTENNHFSPASMDSPLSSNEFLASLTSHSRTSFQPGSTCSSDANSENVTTLPPHML
jgi:hypothetical protein